LNLTDYQNKRKQQTSTTGTNHQNNFVSKITKEGAIEISNDDLEDDGDAWGDDWGGANANRIDDNFDYQNTNLNKLTTE
jgi:hypothetical protein